MTDERSEASGIQCKFSRRWKLTFGFVWIGESLLLFMVAKRLFHLSATWNLLMIPWTLFGCLFAMRPEWVLRAQRAVSKKMDKDLDKLDKWTPPGLP